MSELAKPVATWRKIVAAVLDFFTIFFIGGFAIAKLAGGETANGFELHGLPAFALFALVVAHFVVGSKYLGGRLWQRILGARYRNSPVIS